MQHFESALFLNEAHRNVEADLKQHLKCSNAGFNSLNAIYASAWPSGESIAQHVVPELFSTEY